MNHPEHHEWLAYLDEDAQTVARLNEHLEVCPECAAQLQGWRRSVTRLQNWSWPGRAATPSRRIGPVLQWAAAALLLGLGFVLGHWTESKALHTEVLATLQSNQRSLKDQLARTLADTRAQDRQALLTLVAELQQQRSADYLSLRKDLETVAAVADAGLRRADWQLTEFAALNQPTTQP